MKGGPCGKWENLWGTSGAGRLHIPQEAGGGPSCCCELAGLLEEAARESTGLRSHLLFVFANAFELQEPRVECRYRDCISYSVPFMRQSFI